MKSLLVLVSLVMASSAHASCISMGDNFWDTMANHRKEEKTQKWSPLTIVSGTVVGQYSSGVALFQVDTVLQGSSTSQLVIDMNGGYSVPQSQLPTGTTAVLGLQRDPSSGKYSLSVCGRYFLITAKVR